MIPSPCSSAGYPLDIDTSAASLPSVLERILEERGNMDAQAMPGKLP